MDFVVRSLGLICLADMLSHSPNLLSSYKDYLIESLNKGDTPTKKQVLKILEKYATSEELEEIVGELLRFLDLIEKGIIFVF